jgi:hypothetical protein
MSEAKQRNEPGIPAIGSMLGTAFLKEAERLIDAQGEVLNNLETAVGNWVRRQREALDSSTRSLQKIYECRNLMDLVQVQQHFVADCLHWTAAEMRALGSDAAAVTRIATARAGDMTRSAVEETRHAARAARESAQATRMQERTAAE